MKKNRKVRSALLLLGAMLLCMLQAGCGGKTGESAAGIQTESSTPAAAESSAENGGRESAETQAEQTQAAQTVTAQTETVQAQQEAAAEKETEEAVLFSNADTANFAFTRDNFPTMDGSTSMVPLGKAIASVLLGVNSEEAAELIDFHKTTQSFRNLKDGLCDLLIVGEPNAAVFEEMKEENFEYELEEIATDALIFVVNKENPVDNLSTEQLRDIYSGKITNWKEVGGNDAPIAAFQRNEGAGSQALMKKLVMKETPLAEAPTTLIATEMGDLMESVRSYDNSANAIGYSVYYYANDMKKAEGLKLISVDGVEPCAETIRSREYPHLNAYYCVIDIRQPASSSTRVLFDWLMSKDGQALVAAEGYVAAGDPEKLETALPGGQIVRMDGTFYLSETGAGKQSAAENRFTRLSGGELNTLTARTDYGFLYPYSGSLSYAGDESGYDYAAGALMGFFDEQSRLVTDPVFNSIEALDYYDMDTGTMQTVPVWVFSRALKEKLTEQEEEGVYSYEPLMEYSFASMDGSCVCANWYSYIEACQDRIICTTMDRDGFDAYDPDGTLVLSSDQVELWESCQMDEEWSPEVSYGDGLYVIDASFEETWYVDESGKTVLGPYANARPFTDGRAIAEKTGTEDARFGVIDQQGSWIVEPEFEYITVLKNGNFVCRSGDTVYEIYDRDGEFLNAVEEGSADRTNFGFTSPYRRISEPEQQLRCYDFEGKLLFEDTDGEWQTAGNDGVIYRTMGAGIQLKNIFSGETVYVEGAEQAHPFYRLEDTPDVERILVGNSYYDEETGQYYSHERVYDPELNLLYDQTNVSLSIEEDLYTGDFYLVHDLKGDQVCIRDLDCNEVAVAGGYPEIINGKFIVTDEDACTCCTKDGSIVFRYSLLNSKGD